MAKASIIDLDIKNFETDVKDKASIYVPAIGKVTIVMLLRNLLVSRRLSAIAVSELNFRSDSFKTERQVWTARDKRGEHRQAEGDNFVSEIVFASVRDRVDLYMEYIDLFSSGKYCCRRDAIIVALFEKFHPDTLTDLEVCVRLNRRFAVLHKSTTVRTPLRLKGVCCGVRWLKVHLVLTA